MCATLLAMQNNDGVAAVRPLTPFDTRRRRAYPNHYVSSQRRHGHVLLSPDAGVWVGIIEILPTHPAKAGGFLFSSALEAGAPGGGPTFGIFNR